MAWKMPEAFLTDWVCSQSKQRKHISRDLKKKKKKFFQDQYENPGGIINIKVNLKVEAGAMAQW